MLLLDVTNLVLTVHWQRSSFRGRKKNTHRQILRVHILKLYLFLLPHINFHNLSLLPKSHANKLSGCRLPCSDHINGSLCGRTSSFCMFCPSFAYIPLVLIWELKTYATQVLASTGIALPPANGNIALQRFLQWWSCYGPRPSCRFALHMCGFWVPWVAWVEIQEMLFKTLPL